VSEGVIASVQRVGHAVWVERRLFEGLGGWVPGVDDPRAKVALATQSRHHAWRADQLGTLLSTFGGTDADRLTVAPDDSVDVALDGCATASTATRLAVVLELTGHLLEEYEALRGAASEVADAPALRLLGIVAEDLAHDRRAIEGLLRDE
jgi:hypothetical protein